MQHQWKALAPTFADLQPADLDRVIVVEGEGRTLAHRYALERQKLGRARDTICSELMLLRTVLNWAVKRKRLAASDVPFVWVPSPGKGRRTALNEQEMMQLLGAIVEATFHVRLAFLIAIATGARKEAIAELTWPRVDLENRAIDFNTGTDKGILITGHQKGRAIVVIGDGLYEPCARRRS